MGEVRKERMETINEQKNKGIAKEAVLDLLAFLALCLFLLSPLIQTIRETIAPHKETLFGVIRTYPFTIGTINYFVMAIVVFLWAMHAVKLMRLHRQGNRLSLFVPLVIFGILLVWMYLCQMINGFDQNAYVGDFYRNESLFTFMLYLCGYFFLGTILKSDKLRWAAVLTFLAGSLIMGVLVLIDFFVTPVRMFWDCDGMAAIFNQYNHYGYYLLIAILLSGIFFVIKDVKLPIRVFCAVTFVMNNVILILNDTFGCYLAAIAALVFGAIVIMVIRRNKGECIRMAAVLLAFVAITCVMRVFDYSTTQDMTNLVSDIQENADTNEFSNNTGARRWVLWKHTVQYISEKPIFGWGVEGITERLGNEPDTENDRPHNEYLQWAAFFGIPGALLYLAGLCVIMFGMFRWIKSSDPVSIGCFIASAGYIASAFIGNTMYYTTPFFFIVLGMMCRDRFYTRFDKPNPTHNPEEKPETIERV